MAGDGPTPRRWLRQLVVVPAALSLTVGAAGVAHAAGSAQPAANGTTVPASSSASKITHPDDDYMGSTVHGPDAGANATPSVQTVLPADTTGQAQGVDVSHYQGAVNWNSLAAGGTQFAYMKETEGTGFVDPQFTSNYAGSAAAGLARGAYHFALPDESSGAVQAAYFLAHGAGWVADGHTLPPVLDIESNPYGAECYGLSAAQMVAWLNDFATTIYDQTNRWPVIYTSPRWWSDCTGNDGTLAGYIPLWIVHDAADPGPMPGGWASYTFWQYGTVNGIDADVFNGASADLRSFAVGDGNDKITEHYNELGGASSYLGSATSGVFNVGFGWQQNFQYGVIYYSPATGAHAVNGAILDHYRQFGGPTGVLGFPVTDELTTPDGVGRYNHFANSASIYWTSNTGAHTVGGDIRAKWAQLGWEAGPMGYPTTDETATPDGVGRFNHFSKSASIYWTPNTGAHSIQGAIRAKWASLGWERGTLGYPTTDELTTPDGIGKYNHFNGSGGSSIYFTPNTGAHSVQGAIHAKWAQLGWEAGPLGYPTTDETSTPDGKGRYNHFSNGASIYWTPQTGAWSVRGAIRAVWASLGWERSRLGYPTSDEYGVNGGRRNNFQHGTVTWLSGPNTMQVAYS